jgi:hypothetical protein
MLFSIGLTGVLLAILAQFMLSGVKLWERNDRGYRRQHQMKFIYQMVYNEVSTMLYGEYLPDYIISGDDYKLSFWRESDNGLILVTYRYDFNEKKVYRSEGFYGSSPGDELLFEDIANWQFEYYEPKTRNWLREWTADRKELPALIRITLKTKNSNLGTLTIPVKAWHRNAE